MPKSVYNRSEKPNLVELPGGATRRSIKPGYHLLPIQGIKRIAERFSYGATIHGDEQWLESTEDRDHARAFCKEAFNHMTEHLFEMSNSVDPKTDHLGAIGWAVSVIAYVEDLHECPWTEL